MDSLNVVENAALMWSPTIKVLDILDMLISTNIWNIYFLLYLHDKRCKLAGVCGVDAYKKILHLLPCKSCDHY